MAFHQGSDHNVQQRKERSSNDAPVIVIFGGGEQWG
jgi:hypothetical protein